MTTRSQLLLALSCTVFLAPGLVAQEAGPATPHAAPAAQEAPAKKTRADRTRLTREEIGGASQTDAFMLIQSLRPRWLRTRGASSLNRPAYVQVYQDGVPVGGPDALRRIPREAIRDMQFLDSAAATQRYGTNHVLGAILVRTGA